MAEFVDLVGHLLQQPETQLREPLLTTAAEHDRHLDLVAVPEEADDVALLGVVVVRVDPRPELDLLDDRVHLVAPGLSGLLRVLVLELAVVHQLAHRWPCRRCDLDQVEIGLFGEAECGVDTDDADLLTVRPDEPYLWYPDALVDSQLSADVSSCCSGVRLRMRRTVSFPGAAA